MKILIVDDGSVTRKVSKSILKNLGFRDVYISANAKHGLQCLERAFESNDEFDLVFLDINMPDMTGLELLKIIKSHRFLKKTKVVMQTSESEADVILEAAELGASNYIIKPIDEEQVREKLINLKMLS